MSNNLIPRRTIRHQKKCLDLIDYQECAKMANWGLSASLMQERTKLSLGQIYYRLKQLGIRIKDFRNGKTEEFKLAMELMNEEYYVENLKERIKLRMQELQNIRAKTRAERIMNKNKKEIAA